MNEEEKNQYLSYLNGENARKEAPTHLLDLARKFLKDNRLPQQVKLALNKASHFHFCIMNLSRAIQ